MALATLASRVLPLRRPAARKNLSVEAGNAIEVITSLITTLHAIRDREFVFHERTASTVHPFPVLTSPTLAFPSCACVLYSTRSHERGKCTPVHLHVRITYAAGLSVHKLPRCDNGQAIVSVTYLIRALSSWRGKDRIG